MKKYKLHEITYHPKEWVFIRFDKRFHNMVFFEIGPFMFHIRVES